MNMDNMKEINVKYKFTIYDKAGKEKIVDNLSDAFPKETLFDEMIESLVNKHNINYTQIHVENLKTNTFGKIIGGDLFNNSFGNDYHYKWFKFKLGDIQNIFNLFNQKINIVIDGQGLGATYGKLEGITFIINGNEKDRHREDPHVHCKYAGQETRIRIDTLEFMKNEKAFKNPSKTKKAKEFIKENKEDLLKLYNKLNGIYFEVEI